MASQKPEKVYRLGSISASVFAHKISGAKRIVRSVSVQKRFSDGDETKYTSSFNVGELPNVIRVLQIARDHVESHEAEFNLSD
jgi:hypothetical protein